MNLSLFSFILQKLGSIRQIIKRSLRHLTKLDNHSLALNVALDMTRSKPELVLENALLRQQLSVLQRQVQRPKLSRCDRTLILLLASKLRTWKQALVIVQPDTVFAPLLCGTAICSVESGDTRPSLTKSQADRR